MPPDPELISTAIYRRIMPRLRRAHELRRIGVFVGPPGIGKSTTIDAFRREHAESVAVVVVPPGAKAGVTPRAVLQLAVDALERLVDERAYRDRMPTDTLELRRRLFALVCEWAGLRPSEVKRDDAIWDHCPFLTLIFDEAQNLSREALDHLRFLNEARAGYSPFPIGLAFVGNNEFALEPDQRGYSVLTEAFADRARYIEPLSYELVSDDDLSLFLEALGVVDEAALGLILRHFRAGRRDRSFRRLRDLADDLLEAAEGATVTAEIVKSVLY